jgi:hypothetical protein
MSPLLSELLAFFPGEPPPRLPASLILSPIPPPSFRLILQDLEEPVFSRLFTAEWENSSSTTGDICGTIVATLQDYFRDIEEWIPNYFFSKLCVNTLRSLVYQYCMALKTLTTKNIGFQFGNELSAARHVMTDLGTLTSFFGSYESYLSNGGMGLTLDQELEPIARLARVVCRLLLPPPSLALSPFDSSVFPTDQCNTYLWRH